MTTPVTELTDIEGLIDEALALSGRRGILWFAREAAALLTVCAFVVMVIYAAPVVVAILNPAGVQ